MPSRARHNSSFCLFATAVAGQADCIITGDEDLLVLKEYNRIRILTPRCWLEILDLHEPLQ